MSGATERIADESSLPGSGAALLERVIAWEWNAVADRVIASPNLEAVYGVREISGVSLGLTLVHPDDRQQHEALVHAGVDRRRGYRSSFRIINPTTTTVVWIEERAEAIDQESPYGPQLIGLAFDATLRQDRAAPPFLIAALDALQEYGDALLLLHATARHTGPARHARTVGEWVPAATHALTGLAALVAAADAEPADVIAAETRALKTV